MAKLRTFRTSFAAGHIDEQFLSRSDAAPYHDGCELIENFEVLLSGGARRRPGAGIEANEASRNRVIAWEFDDGTKYILDFGPSLISIRPVEGTAGFTQTVANPLTALWPAGNRELDYVTVLNTMIITHPKIRPQVITRQGTFFSLSDFAFAKNAVGAPLMPFGRFKETRTDWLTLSVPTGAGLAKAWNLAGSTVLRTPYFWTTAHVDRWYRYENVLFQVTGVVAVGPPDPEFGQDYDAEVMIYGSVNDLQLLRLYPAADYTKFEVGDVLTGTTTGATVEVVGFDHQAVVTQSWGNDEEGYREWAISWPGIVVRPLAGSLKAPALGFAGEAPAAETEEVTAPGPITSRTQAIETKTGDAGISINWAEQSWSDARGWPGVVGLHAGRLWLAATDSLPNYLWGSKAQDFFAFDTGDGFPDDAIAAPLSGNMLHRIRFLVDGPHLEIFTDQGEFYVPGYEGRPITPETFSVLPASTLGVLPNCKPVRMNYLTIFAERSGKAVYRMFWDGQSRSYRSQLMTGAAGSLVSNPLELTVQRGRRAEGQEVCWVVNDDGTALQIRWWPESGDQAVVPMRRRPGSGYLSMAYVDDIAWLIGGADASGTLERASDNVLLDSFVAYTEAAATVTFDTPEFDGLEVDVLTDEDQDGNQTDRPVLYLGRFEVTGNTLTLDASYKRIWVGYAFESRLKPTPIDVVPMAGDTRMVPKKIVSYLVPLLDTYFVNVEGRNYFARQPTDGASFPVPLSNEDLRLYQLGYGQRRAPLFVCDLPVPCTILGFAAEVEF